MKQTLTREQMLDKWRRIRAVEPVRLDCTVHRSDSVDLDGILENEMRTRYLELLDSAPTSMLIPVNMASEAQVTFPGQTRMAIVTPPAGTRRILSVGFNSAPPVIPDASVYAVQRVALNPMWHRQLAAPLADGRVMVVAAPGSVLTELNVIFDYGPETYEFDDSLWKELIS